jgi:hypothetical protein
MSGTGSARIDSSVSICPASSITCASAAAIASASRPGRRARTLAAPKGPAA